jgi:uncharacterized repeat protein (TIGR04042 family)
MPEMHFHIRWPDGAEEVCYSPSLIIKDYLATGESYRLAEFLERSRTALNLASERVRLKYGRPCSLALAQLARIESTCRGFADIEDARVRVDAFND